MEKVKYIHVRASESEKEMLRKLAEKHYRTESDYLRFLIAKEYENYSFDKK